MFWLFLPLSSIFDLFQSILNFSIKSRSEIINFVTKIDLDSKNWDQNDLNTIQIQLKPITVPKSIQSP